MTFLRSIMNQAPLSSWSRGPSIGACIFKLLHDPRRLLVLVMQVTCHVIGERNVRGQKGLIYVMMWFPLINMS